jgi:Arc/MetJ family transcription regulator
MISGHTNVPTNLAIDDQLIEQAKKLGHHRTKREAVNAALEEYIRRRRQQAVLTAFGSIEYARDYDYKRERMAHRTGRG